MIQRSMHLALGALLLAALGCAGAVQPFPGRVEPPPEAGARSAAPESPAASPAALDERLAAGRPRVTGEQLEALRALPLEACWGALQGLGYKRSFEGGFLLTHPEKKTAGRAVTLRYLPVRPDLVEAARKLAEEGGWNPAFNLRAGDVLESGDLVLVELGGMVERATFVGDVTALAIQERGAAGIVVDGGIRDYDEIRHLDIPCYVRGIHASAMEDQVGVEWNVAVRIGGITVLPGDAILADASGILAIPPQLVEQVIEKAQATIEKEEFIREKVRSRKHRASDLYPTPKGELQKELEEWRARRAAEKTGKEKR